MHRLCTLSLLSITVFCIQLPYAFGADIAGPYTGHYICAQGQGKTALRMGISDQGGGTLSAVFAFYPPGSSPDSPLGVFTLKGQYNEQTGSVKLEPDKWLKRPSGYKPVGMSGIYNPSEGTLIGSITTKGCGEFQLVRNDARSAAAEETPSQSFEDVLTTSRITKLYELTDTPGETPDVLNTEGFRRPDFISPLYTGKWYFVPNAGLDNLRYYAQTLGDLKAQCPELGLDNVIWDILPYIVSAVRDSTQRIFSGRASPSEMFQAALAMVEIMGSTEFCTFDPDSIFEPVKCTEGKEINPDLIVPPSLNASYDVALMKGLYGCTGEEMKRYANNLAYFAKFARAQPFMSSSMPPLDTPQGKRYLRIFENCSRQGGDASADDWCGCYVRTLFEQGVPDNVISALESNPFVDGKTYMTGLIKQYPKLSKLYDCEKQGRKYDSWRESKAPRTTACLIETEPLSDGRQQCLYKTAWGEFTLFSPQCKSSITSRLWGYDEVECDGATIASLPRTGPVKWKEGLFTKYDYENEVPAGFVPPIPVFTARDLPISIRMLKQENMGSLRSIEIHEVSGWILGSDAFSIKGAERDIVREDIAIISKEEQLYLNCQYWKEKGVVSFKNYWYKTVPRYIRETDMNKRVPGHPLLKVGGPVTNCPPRYE